MVAAQGDKDPGYLNMILGIGDAVQRQVCGCAAKMFRNSEDGL